MSAKEIVSNLISSEDELRHFCGVNQIVTQDVPFASLVIDAFLLVTSRLKKYTYTSSDCNQKIQLEPSISLVPSQSVSFVHPFVHRKRHHDRNLCSKIAEKIACTAQETDISKIGQLPTTDASAEVKTEPDIDTDPEIIEIDCSKQDNIKVRHVAGCSEMQCQIQCYICNVVFTSAGELLNHSWQQHQIQPTHSINFEQSTTAIGQNVSTISPKTPVHTKALNIYHIY